jgi:hypothetical protein
MNSDTDLTFGDIHGSTEVFLDQIIEIQDNCIVSRNKAINWAHHLRFLEVPLRTSETKVQNQAEAIGTDGTSSQSSETYSTKNVLLPARSQ